MPPAARTALRCAAKSVEQHLDVRQFGPLVSSLTICVLMLVRVHRACGELAKETSTALAMKAIDRQNA